LSKTPYIGLEGIGVLDLLSKKVKISANTCSALNVVLLLQVVDPLNVSLGKTLV